MLFHWACKSTKFELSKARRTVWAVQKPRSAGPAALTVAAVVAARELRAGGGGGGGGGGGRGSGGGALLAAANTPRKRRATVCILRCVFVANHKAQLDHSSELTLVRNGLVR